ncbi:MAG: MlaD family protein, partial [Methylophilaceae bacterium]
MDRIKLDAWVGIFVALGLIALMGLAMKVGNLTSNDIKTTYVVTANFENIGGLKPRAPVKSAGVVVGRVD